MRDGTWEIVEVHQFFIYLECYCSEHYPWWLSVWRKQEDKLNDRPRCGNCRKSPSDKLMKLIALLSL